MDLEAHYNRLLTSGRCSRCAERVPRAAILGGDQCKHCGASLGYGGGDVVDSVAARQFWWRLKGYALIAAGSFVAGTMPFLQLAVQIAALFVLHVVVLRGGLRWLPPGRRILARMTMKILGASISAVALMINTAVAPLLGAGALVLAVSGPVLTAIYVEGSLWLLRRRLRWEAAGRPVRIGEWVVPVVLVVALLAAVGAMAAMVWGTVYLVSGTEVPAITEISEFLLEVVP